MQTSSRPHAFDALRPLTAWLGVGLVLHLVWEIAQLPLYTIFRDAGTGFIAFAVFHCLLGDVVISAVSYGVAAGLLRDMRWSISRPWVGALIAFPLGVTYTGWSEWYNVYRAGSWQYMPAMPLVFGVGLSPLLQWLFVPAGTLLLLRRSRYIRAA